MIVGLIASGCSDADGFVYPDPNDPLLGEWQPIDSDEQATGGNVARFRSDGSYQFGSCAGRWSRIDVETIHLENAPCDLPERDSLVRIEADYMLIDGLAGMSMWSWAGTGGCTQHGGTVTTGWSVRFDPDGGVRGMIGGCNGTPGGTWSPCSGTWSLKPFGLNVIATCESYLWDDYFRLSDAIAPVGYRRISP